MHFEIDLFKKESFESIRNCRKYKHVQESPSIGATYARCDFEQWAEGEESPFKGFSLSNLETVSLKPQREEPSPTKQIDFVLGVNYGNLHWFSCSDSIAGRWKMLVSLQVHSLTEHILSCFVCRVEAGAWAVNVEGKHSASELFC